MARKEKEWGKHVNELWARCKAFHFLKEFPNLLWRPLCWVAEGNKIKQTDLGQIQSNISSGCRYWHNYVTGYPTDVTEPDSAVWCFSWFLNMLRLPEGRKHLHFHSWGSGEVQWGVGACQPTLQALPETVSSPFRIAAIVLRGGSHTLTFGLQPQIRRDNPLNLIN